MKGPPKLKQPPKMAKNPAVPKKLGTGVTGGNMDGLATGLALARPAKLGRVAGLKNKLFGGGK